MRWIDPTILWWLNLHWCCLANEHGAEAYWWFYSREHGYIWAPPYPIQPPRRSVVLVNIGELDG